MLQSLPHIVISFIMNEKTALRRAIVSLASRESLPTVRLDCPPFNPTHAELAWNAWLRHHFPPCNVWVVNIHEGVYQWRLQRHMEATASILGKFAPKRLSLFTHNFLMFWQFLADLPHEWRLMTHLRSEAISQQAKDWLLLLPGAISSHFCTEYMLQS